MLLVRRASFKHSEMFLLVTCQIPPCWFTFDAPKMLSTRASLFISPKSLLSKDPAAELIFWIQASTTSTPLKEAISVESIPGTLKNIKYIFKALQHPRTLQKKY